MSTRDFTDFSTDEIADIAKKAGEKARQESLDAGLEVISQDMSTGKFYASEKNESGEIVKRELTPEEVKDLPNGRQK